MPARPSVASGVATVVSVSDTVNPSKLTPPVSAVSVDCDVRARNVPGPVTRAYRRAGDSGSLHGQGNHAPRELGGPLVDSERQMRCEATMARARAPGESSSRSRPLWELAFADEGPTGVDVE